MPAAKHKGNGACLDRGEDICAECLGMARDSGREKGLKDAARVADDHLALCYTGTEECAKNIASAIRALRRGAAGEEKG